MLFKRTVGQLKCEYMMFLYIGTRDIGNVSGCLGEVKISTS